MESNLLLVGINKVLKFSLAALLMLLSFETYSQSTKKSQKIIKVVQERSIYLNGGTRAIFGGKSRVTIPVSLPEGTISWYYSFTTSPGESGTANLNLFAQLSSIVLDPSGITKASLSQINIPEGSNSLDVYLIDQDNKSLFEEKEPFRHYPTGAVENTKSAIVDVNEPNSGSYYLGLKNPSSLDGLNVQIEVVALVQTEIKQTDEESEAITTGNLGWKSLERGEYNRCIELSKKALELDNTLVFVHYNLGLAYLLKGQSSDAIRVYTKAITLTKKLPNPKENFQAAINDITTYQNKCTSKEDTKDIYDILLAEYNKYE